MAKISVHYDGWIALPTRLRQFLGLQTGNELEAEVRGGELILRATSEASTAEAPAAAPESAAAPVPTEDKPAPKRGRPRKIAVPVQSVKAVGRRKSVDAPPSKRKP